jgi:glutathione S-transferase
MSNKRQKTMIVIQYWSIMARASGLFRMCAEAGVEWKHIASREEMGAALFGAKSSNLAPPILQDGDVILSQAVPCHQYLGNKFGFNKDIPVPEVALQYMEDLSDLHSQMADASMEGKATNDVHALQKYLTGDRYKYHLGAINRSIKGPFYFGDNPTYVDFAVCSYLDMCEGKWLIPLEPKSGDTLAKYAPKLKAIATAIRDLPSATQNEKISKLPWVPPPLVLKSDRVATWKE